MSERLRSYGVARTIFGIVEFVGWCVVVIGVIVGFALAGSAARYVSGGEKFLLFLAGASGSLLGLFLVGSVQNWRAGVDSAEYGQQMLKVARDQLEVSKQSLKRQEVDSHSFAALKSPTEQAPTTSFEHTEPRATRQPEAAEHRGHKIYRVGGSYRAAGEVFPNHADAVAAIDAKLDAPAIESKPEIPVPELSTPEPEAPGEAELLPAEQVATVEETPPPRSYAERAEDNKPSSVPVPEAVQAEEGVLIELAEQDPTPSVDDVSVSKETKPGPRIEEENGKFVYGRMEFSSREAAEKYVSQLGVNPNFQS